MTAQRLSLVSIPCLSVVLASLLVACSTHETVLLAPIDAGDDNASDAVSDDGPRTCSEAGQTYAVGAIIPRANSCVSCRCLAGGIVGQCTGACATDASTDGATVDAVQTCTDNGVTFAVGDVIPRGSCGSCLCLEGGAVGHCTGACP